MKRDDKTAQTTSSIVENISTNITKICNDKVIGNSKATCAILDSINRNLNYTKRGNLILP